MKDTNTAWELIQNFLMLWGIMLAMGLFFLTYLFGMKIFGFLMDWEPADSLWARKHFRRKETGQKEVGKKEVAQKEVTEKEATQKEVPQEEPTQEEAVENDIFKHYIDGRPLNTAKLRDWIRVHFLPRVTYNYDWFALWRLLRDHNLFDTSKDSTARFTKQMTTWFPDNASSCQADAINIYKSGYLGRTPHQLWSRQVFSQQIRPKQAKEGYDRLDSLYNELAMTFKVEELKALSM